MSKKIDSDPWVKAVSPVYLVLCENGDPHPEGLIQKTQEPAEKDRHTLDARNLPCGPHRVQAYRPMW